MGNNRELLINIENLSKYYKLYDKPSDRLKEALNPFSKNYHKDFAALKDISLTIKKGEAVGIIGKNGAGKSTLLKIITGVLSPSSGNIEVNGKISALLELGAGFNPEFTGLENIYLNGTIMGFTKEEMDKKLPDILNFADIGDFIYQPVKTYSSGMFARLAFSVSINVEPDILIVDEALSVGDMYFQAKCMKKIKELMETGVTTLFVSHDTMAVKSLCTRAVYIDHGTIVADGDSGEVCDQYINDTLRNTGSFSNLNSEETKGFSDPEEMAIQSNFEEDSKVIEYKNRVRDFRNGTFELEVIYVTTVDDKNKETTEFLFNEQITVKIYIKSNVEIKEAIIACYIKDKNQINVIGTNSTYEGIEINNLKKDSIYMLEFKFTNKLMAGNYSISVLAVDALLNSKYYERVDNTFIFKTLDIPNKRRWALVSLPMDVQFKKIN